jgi:phosphate-selective porin OprO/OprP
MVRSIKNDRKDIAWRLAVRPFHCEDATTLLGGLQLGFAMTQGIEQESINLNPLRTPGQEPWFTYNATVRANGERNRYSPELVYFHGPLGFAAQYYFERQRLSPAFLAPGGNRTVDVDYEGFYVLATYLLTGESRTDYSQAITPLRSFEPRHTIQYCGAWEAVARVSRLHVDPIVFAPGITRLADPAGNSPGATELTVGFNWYLNPYVRVQFNWEYSWFDDLVRLGPGPAGLVNHDNTVLTRFQVIY